VEYIHQIPHRMGLKTRQITSLDSRWEEANRLAYDLNRGINGEKSRGRGRTGAEKDT